MYLKINGDKYPLRRRKRAAGSVTYSGMETVPETVSGLITMYRDDGYMLSTDDADSYARQVRGSSTLTLTNTPEPEGTEKLMAEASADEVLDVLLGVTE